VPAKSDRLVYVANAAVKANLLARIKSGRYIAPPVRRHYIPKADGTERPLGIPTLEDKVAQRAGSPAAGADLRDGLPAVLVRLPIGTIRP
jgi:retron-type reverse transcriptase